MNNRSGHGFTLAESATDNAGGNTAHHVHTATAATSHE